MLRTPLRRTIAPALWVVTLFALSGCSSPGLRRVQPVVWREPMVDIVHYDIDVSIDHEAGYLDGSVEIHYRGLPDASTSQLVLDAVDLDISGAWNGDGHVLQLEAVDDTLVIELERPALPGVEAVVRLSWSCFPQRGLIFVPPTAKAPERPWHVWTQGQSEDTRHWMPVWDIPNEMATHELTVSLDASLTSMGAGTLLDSYLSKRTGQRTETWSSDRPHVSYLITFLAGGFAEGQLPGGEVPLPVLADPADLALALENSRHTADMLEFLGELTGVPYPYSKYAQTFVHDFTAGGMENVSATTLYDEGLHDPSDEPYLDLTDLLAHEAAHQWFGDLLCGNGWQEIWLNEGFANYCEALYMAEREGPARLSATLRDWQQAAMAREWVESHPIVWDGFTDPDETFDEHAYEGGAARLHLLRDQLGETVFLSGLRAYVGRHQGEIVTTEDFQRAMEEASGRDLQQFFDEWLHSPGYPNIAAHIETGTDGADTLHLEQLALRADWPSVFHANLEVSWSRNGLEQTERVALEGATARLALGSSEGSAEPSDGLLDWVHVDSSSALPGRITLAQPAGAWARQLKQAQHPMARLLAAEWFAGDRWAVGPDAEAPALDDTALAALRHAALRDSFPDVRVRALDALAAFAATPAAPQSLAIGELVMDDDPRVREAAIRVLAAAPGDAGILLLRRAVDDSYSLAALAAITALVELQDPGAYRTLTRVFESSGPYRIRFQRDLVSLAASMGRDDVLPFLIRVARTHPQRWVRTAAVDALALWQAPHGERVFQQLCSSLHDESYHVRLAAARALGARGDSRARRHLNARMDLEGYGFVHSALRDALDVLEAGVE